MSTIIMKVAAVFVVAWTVAPALWDPGFWPLFLPLVVMIQTSTLAIVLVVTTGLVLYRKVRQ